MLETMWNSLRRLHTKKYLNYIGGKIPNIKFVSRLFKNDSDKKNHNKTFRLIVYVKSLIQRNFFAQIYGLNKELGLYPKLAPKVPR